MITKDMKHKLIKKEEITSWGKQIYYNNTDKSIRFALYYYNDEPSILYFSNLYIDEKYRNRWIGQKILDYAFKYAKKHRYKDIILNAVKDSWVQKWYERNGFEYLEDADGEYVGNAWMIKKL